MQLLASLALSLLLRPRPVRAAPRTAENAAFNVNVETGSDPSTFRGEWPGHDYHPSPRDWRKLPVYQLLTDRFADGNPQNNEEFHPWKGFDVRDMTYRHGGDFKGLAEKLDYIQGLGCHVIWISPIFQNGFNSYHQYAQHDFTLLDKRLGSLEDFRHLVSEAHRRNMYVLVDIVVNHMANELTFEGHERSASPFRQHTDREYRQFPRCKERECEPQELRPQPYKDFHVNNTWDEDGKYTFKYKIYDHLGNGYEDTGSGTYTWSDFHHNGDLQDYKNVWHIHSGKIYGIMDDLRTESESVQKKLIAMSQALIASTDVDGFRIDTPMQVDLGFFKAWVPAVRQFAASLGKDNFGMWGEFYCEEGRFATMVGRGKAREMHGQKDEFIDDVFTMYGGIDYRYHHCLRHALFSPLIDRVAAPAPATCTDPPAGIVRLQHQESDFLDLYNPQTKQEENNMWHFCNNHDQWRLQAAVAGGSGAGSSSDSVDGLTVLKACLVWLTFWTGIPLHYAGDEQGFATPGTALDGWAREELALSHSWRGLRGVPAKDNFDMTSPMYLYVQKLNLIRSAYYDKILSCDTLSAADYETDDKVHKPFVLAWWRGGCDDAIGEERMLVVERLQVGEEPWRVQVATPWPPGTPLLDPLDASAGAAYYEVGADGGVELWLPAYGAAALVRKTSAATAPLAPVVVKVHPAHDAVYEDSSLHFWFDQKVRNDQVTKVLLDDQDLRSTGHWKEQWCAETSGCLELGTLPLLVDLTPGVHHVALHLDQGVFRSRFRVSGRGAEARSADPIIDPLQHSDHELVAADFRSLAPFASGATHFRARNVDAFEWSEWRPLAPGDRVEWTSTPGVPVVAQYYAAGSAGYLVGGCRDSGGNPCNASFYSAMWMRGPGAEWEKKIRMDLVEPWTWAGDLVVQGIGKVFFVPFDDGSVKFGTMMTLQVQRAMMTSSADKVWPADARTSLGSGAEWCQPLRVDACCNLLFQIEEVPEPTLESAAGPCQQEESATCRVFFNDRTFELWVQPVEQSPPTPAPTPVPAPPPVPAPVPVPAPAPAEPSEEETERIIHWDGILWLYAVFLGTGLVVCLVWFCVRPQEDRRPAGGGGEPLREAQVIELEARNMS